MIVSKTRAGVTLTEVLVAILIMGIGLLSLMVLFPVGAMNMAQAIKDDRTAHAAQNAEAVFRALKLQNDPFLWNAWKNGNPASPVYVDPIGTTFLPATQPNLWTPVGGGGTAIQRTTINQPGQTTMTPLQAKGPWPYNRGGFPNTLYWFAALDDISFAANAGATDGNGKLGTGYPTNQSGAVDRDILYSWAYLCRQVKPTSNGPPSTDGVEFSIAVYKRRVQSTGRENAYPATFSTSGYSYSSGQVTITFSGNPPPIQKGTWILDGTYGYFYRVSSAEVSGSGTMLVVLASPLRATGGSICVVMQDVAEVFEKAAK